MIAACQQWHHGDQRDRGDVLKQQNRKCQPAVRAGQFLAFGQALQAKGSGRQGKAQAQHDGAVQRLTEDEQRQYANHRTRQQHLRQAHAEH
ncbi:hypothetical protein D3C85_1755360 [compost metagenome]